MLYELKMTEVMGFLPETLTCIELDVKRTRDVPFSQITGVCHCEKQCSKPVKNTGLLGFPSWTKALVHLIICPIQTGQSNKVHIKQWDTYSASGTHYPGHKLINCPRQSLRLGKVLGNCLFLHQDYLDDLCCQKLQ